MLGLYQVVFGSALPGKLAGRRAPVGRAGVLFSFFHGLSAEVVLSHVLAVLFETLSHVEGWLRFDANLL